MTDLDLSRKKKLQIPFDVLIVNWSFVEIGDEKFVLGIKPSVTGVVRFMESGGEGRHP